MSERTDEENERLWSQWQADHQLCIGFVVGFFVLGFAWVCR